MILEMYVYKMPSHWTKNINCKETGGVHLSFFLSLSLGKDRFCELKSTHCGYCFIRPQITRRTHNFIWDQKLFSGWEFLFHFWQKVCKSSMYAYWSQIVTNKICNGPIAYFICHNLGSVYTLRLWILKNLGIFFMPSDWLKNRICKLHSSPRAWTT